MTRRIGSSRRVAVSYTVDADGNLVVRGGDSFGYDQADRLTATDIAGMVASYVYDGDGNRQAMMVGSDPAVEYVYDVTGALAVVLGDGDRKYVWGLGLAYTVDSSDTASFDHADGLVVSGSYATTHGSRCTSPRSPATCGNAAETARPSKAASATVV